eukprot:PLAT1151.1.p2 GENE.PLAT1151.1~~PLAT1151.1.p2  ORF type:complete len:329 (-),score=149.35 PLAT1151.1:83-1069(-)
MADPTVLALQERVADLLGMEAALLVASGSMGNLLSLGAHVGRGASAAGGGGQEILVGDACHILHYEQGGAAALFGAAFSALPTGDDGQLALSDISAAVRDSSDAHYAHTALLCVENTHNMAGGAVLSPQYMRDVGQLAAGLSLPVHVDGARLFNAAAALDCPVSELVADADSVTFCLSKGLGAPVGSVVAGDADFIARVHRLRKMVGGGWRQAGVLAAAGLYSLEHVVPRLGEDHARATALADAMRPLPGVALHPHGTASNIVYFGLDADKHDVTSFVDRMAARGVLVGGGYSSAAKLHWRQFRVVLHVDVDDAGLQQAIDAMRAELG